MQPSAGKSGAVVLTDAVNSVANERLFVAYLVPVEGSSGIATVRLQGDNASGNVSLTGDDLKGDVARFLTQSTFGPTEVEITALTQRVEVTHSGDRITAYTEWIDEQLALDQISLEAYTLASDSQEWFLLGTDPLNYTASTGSPGSANRRRGWTASRTSVRPWTFFLPTKTRLSSRDYPAI